MRQHRVDGTHKEIVKGVRALGYRLFDTSAFGDGYPDMVVVSKNGRVAMLFENKPETEGKVTIKEVTYMMRIVEPVYRIVTTPEQVVEIMQDLEKGVKP